MNRPKLAYLQPAFSSVRSNFVVPPPWGKTTTGFTSRSLTTVGGLKAGESNAFGTSVGNFTVGILSPMTSRRGGATG